MRVLRTSSARSIFTSVRERSITDDLSSVFATYRLLRKYEVAAATVVRVTVILSFERQLNTWEGTIVMYPKGVLIGLLNSPSYLS